MIEDNICVVSGLQNEYVMPVEARDLYNHENDRFIVTKWRISDYSKSYLQDGYGATTILKEPNAML